MARGINARHRQAQFAGRQSTDLHAYVYFKNQEVVTENAFVMRCRKNGVMCLVPKYGIEVPIYFTASNQPGGYTLSEDGMSISGGPGGGHTVRMLDKLRVEVSPPTLFFYGGAGGTLIEGIVNGHPQHCFTHTIFHC